MENKHLCIFFLALLLASCQVDPRKVASAQVTLEQQTQESLNQEQQRRFLQDGHDLAYQHQLTMQIATTPEKIAAKTKIIRNLGNLAVVSLWIIGILASIGTGITLLGTGFGISLKLFMQACTIKIDRKTGQFPIFMTYMGHGRFAVHNPNTGSLIYLDTTRKEDRDMILGSYMVQVARVLADRAHPTAIPDIRVPTPGGFYHEEKQA